MFRAIQLFAANTKTERGDAIFILYLESKLVPAWAGLPRSRLGSSLLSTRDKDGKEVQGLAKSTQTRQTTDPPGREKMQLIINNFEGMQGNSTAGEAASKDMWKILFIGSKLERFDLSNAS